MDFDTTLAHWFWHYPNRFYISYEDDVNLMKAVLKELRRFEKFSVNSSISLFVICVNLLHP